MIFHPRSNLRKFINHLTGRPNHAHPLGHFYSPIVDPRSLDIRKLWPEKQSRIEGIDFNDRSHKTIIQTLFYLYMSEFDYPEKGPSDVQLKNYYVGNSQFGWLDARLLFVLQRYWQPRQIIEIGSGYSTLLIDDINRRFNNQETKVTAIDPFPRPFIQDLDNVFLIRKMVQNVDIEIFSHLDKNDILFVDSSHVCKTGSDVNFILFEILPILKPGVHVHFHDIFLPEEYPKDWVIDENRSWNEQYILRALLMYNTKFRVTFSSMYAFIKYENDLASALRTPDAMGGCSLWIEVI